MFFLCCVENPPLEFSCVSGHNFWVWVQTVQYNQFWFSYSRVVNAFVNKLNTVLKKVPWSCLNSLPGNHAPYKNRGQTSEAYKTLVTLLIYFYQSWLQLNEFSTTMIKSSFGTLHKVLLWKQWKESQCWKWWPNVRLPLKV